MNATEQPGFALAPLVYVLLGAMAILVIASLTGNGTGMFGWGWMMGMMWFWLVVPFAVLALIAFAALQRPRTE